MKLWHMYIALVVIALVVILATRIYTTKINTTKINTTKINMQDSSSIWNFTRNSTGVYESTHIPIGLVPMQTIGDGNCFFHAVLDAVDVRYRQAKIAKDWKTVHSLAQEARQRLVDTYDFRKEDFYRYWTEDQQTNLTQNIIVPYINEQLLDGAKFEDLFPHGFRPQHEEDIRKLNDGIASYMSRDGYWISYGMVKNNVAEQYGVNLSLLIGTPQELKLFRDITEYHSAYEENRPSIFLNRKGDHFESVIIILQNKKVVYSWTHIDIPQLADWMHPTHTT